MKHGLSLSTLTRPTMPASILVAEDDPHDQLLMVMAAQDCDVDVTFSFVENGEEVMTELRTRASAGAMPDMVVLDMRMPRMDGHEVLDALRDEPAIRPEKVGVFSSSYRQQDIDLSLEKGAMWHRVKPSKYEELVDFVTEIATQCDAGHDLD